MRNACGQMAMRSQWGLVDDRTGSRVRMNLYPEIPYFVRRLYKLDDLRNQLACDIVASFSSDMITSAGF